MKNNKKLSVVLATKNEAMNIERCLLSVQSIADEIIVFDEESTDNTKELAEGLGAKVFTVKHEDIFHITKQNAIEAARGEWILQLDADEVVTRELSQEVIHVIGLPNKKLKELKEHNLRASKYFGDHQKLLENRDGRIGNDTGEVVAFFVPRLNIFLGKPLKRGGVYPDGVIRLFKRGKAWLPGKSVHEQMEVDGEVGWLVNPLEHYDSPSFSRYIARNNRYTSLIAKDYKKQNVKKNIFNAFYFIVYKPLYEFANLFFRHKAILDGYRGFIWSFFSALRFPVSYLKYWGM